MDELEGLLERQEYIKEDGIPAFENVMESVLQSGRDEKNDRFIECKIKRSSTLELILAIRRVLRKSRSHNFYKLLTSSPSAVPHLQVRCGGSWI